MKSLNPFQRLKELEELKENWDSYGGKPIDREVLKATIELLLGLAVSCPMPQHIVPTARGGIQLEWQAKSKELEVEITTVEKMDVLYEEPGKTWEMTMPFSPAFLTGLLNMWKASNALEDS